VSQQGHLRTAHLKVRNHGATLLRTHGLLWLVRVVSQPTGKSFVADNEVANFFEENPLPSAFSIPVRPRGTPFLLAKEDIRL